MTIDGTLPFPLHSRPIATEPMDGSDTHPGTLSGNGSMDLQKAIQTGHAVAEQTDTGNDLGEGQGDAALDLDGHLPMADLRETGLPLVLPRRGRRAGPGVAGTATDAVETLDCDGDMVEITAALTLSLGRAERIEGAHIVTIRQIGGAVAGEETARAPAMLEVTLRIPGSDLTPPRRAAGQSISFRLPSPGEARAAVTVLQRAALSEGISRLGHGGAARHPLQAPPSLEELRPIPGALAAKTVAASIAPGEELHRLWHRTHAITLETSAGPHVCGWARQARLDGLGVEALIDSALARSERILYRNGTARSCAYGLSGPLRVGSDIGKTLVSLGEFPQTSYGAPACGRLSLSSLWHGAPAPRTPLDQLGATIRWPEQGWPEPDRMALLAEVSGPADGLFAGSESRVRLEADMLASPTGHDALRRVLGGNQMAATALLGGTGQITTHADLAATNQAAVRYRRVIPAGGSEIVLTAEITTRTRHMILRRDERFGDPLAARPALPAPDRL
ncbi:MAG: hypothetical protein AAFR17_13190 [Pseudomonadota bacterium]